MGAAIKTDGTLWVWGANAYGELGLDVSGALGKRSSPVQVGALTTWSQIKAGTVATAALKTDGTLWLWGRNNYGQLGQNIPTSTNRSSPVQVGALTTWSKIANSGYHVVAIKTDGTLWSWGANGSGQLGLGNTVYRSSPVQVGALTTWSDTAVGAYFTMATKTDGTLWTWGNNAFGELGQGTATGLSSPVQVGALTTWSNIAGGDRHTMATKTDGTLWTWGRNQAGQLGLNDAADPFDVPINRSSPVQVGALTTWSRVSGGTNFSMALTAA
jgi:alpha-tubulin suppressor-like RCC1 family protein